jgi:putative peptidoglycan lipid II flippase
MFASMLVVMVLTGVTKLVVVVRELVIADQFGTGEVVDAFLIAFLLPMFAINVLAGSFSSAMMPAYIRTRKDKGRAAAQQLFASMLALGTLFLVVTFVILAILAPAVLPFLASGFSTQNLALTQSLFYWLLPVFVLTGIGHLYAVALNADERFAAVSLLPLVTPIFAVISLIFLVDRWGIYALAGGTLVGALIELLLLARVASRRRISLLPRWSGMTDDLRTAIGQYAPMVAGAFLMSGTIVVDQAMAAMLEPGSVSALNYASRVVALILGIGATALGTVVLPHFSTMVAEHDWRGVRHTFRTYARLIVVLSIPITAMLFIFSETIVGVLFERGAFNQADTALVGEIQAFYVLQIPFYILGILGVRLLSAAARNETLMKISFINLIANVSGNYLFMQYLGVAGIALSTAVVYALSFFMIYFSLFGKNAKTGNSFGQ